MNRTREKPQARCPRPQGYCARDRIQPHEGFLHRDKADETLSHVLKGLEKLYRAFTLELYLALIG